MSKFPGLNQASKRNKKPLQGKSSLKEQEEPKTLVFSFKDFDINQGQCFTDWHNCNLLVDLLERVRNLSTMTLTEAEGKKFKVYGNFPCVCKEFKHPPFVAEDAQWACFHVKGKECVAGHVYKNVFYIVFLDKEHKFWPSKLR